ncbi:protein 60A [Cimex lectularius]|uniref:TGF-beta family profile domain-containing protein n=2 Tax=Cimex lectularius TaxID=79782 RepID=A0A8I6TKC0_CIMLE|nr:protein 60A [Cimex lectularius]
MGSLTLVKLLLCQLVALSAARLSGLYIDNGIDQTLIQRVLTRQEKREVQHEILNLLGLPDRPRPSGNRIDRGSASMFLLDVYKSLLDSASETKTSGSQFNISDNDLQAIDESDVIMSFTSRHQDLPNMRHEKGKRLLFDVSEVSPSQTIMGAELRLYQSSNYTIKSDNLFTVSVYMVLSEKENKNSLEFVDSVNTTYDNEGWLIFNVTGVFTNWVAFPDSNKGLYLRIYPHDSPGNIIHAEKLGITTLPGNKDNNEIDKQPFMVAFLQGGTESKQRVKRQVKNRKKKADQSENPYSRSPLLEPPHIWQHSQRSCQIQTLYVSFRDLEWQDWIIAPDGYGAFYCSGECNFPLNAHMNATNHAIVQTLVHLINPLQVPKPCCAPTKLTPISVLYYVDDSNVLLKKYKNMVVKSCGCH